MRRKAIILKYKKLDGEKNKTMLFTNFNDPTVRWIGMINAKICNATNF
ncbi:hypothetical protein [Desulfosarcina alkanivorans]|nr:hypothetical protein [Desulfosarcina alkanivorans]